MNPLTFGTTFLNHGLGDNSSANQVAVAEPASLARVYIWHSFFTSEIEKLDVLITTDLENAHQLQDDYVPGLLRGPRCSYPTLQHRYDAPRHLCRFSQLFGQTRFRGALLQLTACSSLQPKAKHTQYHSHRACVWPRPRPYIQAS